MPPPLRYTQAQVLEAIEKGITKVGTAKVLGCSWLTVHNYERRWKAVAQAFQYKRLEVVDLAEMGLRGAVLKQEPWAVTFALKTLARDIYAEAVNVRHGNEQDKPLVVKHVGAADIIAAERAFLGTLGLEPPRVVNDPGHDHSPHEGADTVSS